MCHTFVVFTADYQGMACAAFVIKEGEHINVHLELILVQMDIVEKDWVWDSIEMVTVKHLFFL